MLDGGASEHGDPPPVEAVRPRASVVIPAYNEEPVIARCLDVLLLDALPGEFEVIVVANGCKDRTADVARAHGVRVVETPVGSKSHALNLGDQAATTFPRLYLDADIELSTVGARAIADAMSRPGALTAATRLVPKFGPGHTRPLKQYYHVWTQLPYVRNGVVGSGLYALSAEGRSRFAQFPPIIADDRFVERLFTAQERTRVNTSFVMHPPLRVRDLARVMARAWTGNVQLEKSADVLLPAGAPLAPMWKAAARRFFAVARQPSLCVALPVYICVYVYVRLVGSLRARRGRTEWVTDSSARLGRP
jgi:glycosyltransferase involved in cell wall biosynthesis